MCVFPPFGTETLFGLRMRIHTQFPHATGLRQQLGSPALFVLRMRGIPARFSSNEDICKINCSCTLFFKLFFISSQQAQTITLKNSV